MNCQLVLSLARMLTITYYTCEKVIYGSCLQPYSCQCEFTHHIKRCCNHVLLATVLLLPSPSAKFLPMVTALILATKTIAVASSPTNLTSICVYKRKLSINDSYKLVHTFENKLCYIDKYTKPTKTYSHTNP